MSIQGASAAALTRHDRRKRATRLRVLAAAAELFGERGVQETKISDICARADIAHQTFFNHFPTKRELLHEMSRAGVDFLVAAMDAACSRQGSTRERLADFLRTMTAATVEVGPHYRELMTEILHASQEIHREEESRRIHAAFARLVRAGVRQGDVTRRHDPEVVVELVAGAYYALVSDWVARADFDIERRAAQMAELLGDVLKPRAAERRPPRGGRPARDLRR